MTAHGGTASKSRLRGQALAARDALDPVFRIEASLALAQFQNALELRPSDTVGGFLPIRSEIDLRPLLSVLARSGSILSLPAVEEGGVLTFRRFDRQTPLVQGAYGTLHPGDDAEECEPSLLLMPLAAFDGQGNRIGYGGGYYDRYIASRLANGVAPRRIGVAFDCQRVEAVPAEAHDVTLEAVLTESGLHRTGPLR